VPRYSLLAVGSDVIFPEMICGPLEMARSCAADMLAAKVADDFSSEEEASSLARKMFLDSGVAL
jgi:hypothetical protein